jgi:hypothetical protein
MRAVSPFLGLKPELREHRFYAALHFDQFLAYILNPYPQHSWLPEMRKPPAPSNVHRKRFDTAHGPVRQSDDVINTGRINVSKKLQRQMDALRPRPSYASYLIFQFILHCGDLRAHIGTQFYGKKQSPT